STFADLGYARRACLGCATSALRRSARGRRGGVQAERHHQLSVGSGQNLQRLFRQVPGFEGGDARTAAESIIAVRSDGAGDSVRSGPAGHLHGRTNVTRNASGTESIMSEAQTSVPNP